MKYQLADLNETGRVWVYAANRILTPAEQQELQALGDRFCAQWTAHDKPLKAAFEIRDNLFLILGADESLNPISGCGIDKSVAFIKELDKTYELNLFNRMQIEIRHEGRVQIQTKEAIREMQALTNQAITTFDKTISDIRALHEAFEIPLEKAWFYKSVVPAQKVV